MSLFKFPYQQTLPVQILLFIKINEVDEKFHTVSKQAGKTFDDKSGMSVFLARMDNNLALAGLSGIIQTISVDLRDISRLKWINWSTGTLKI